MAHGAYSSRQSPMPLILAGAAFALAAFLVWDRWSPPATAAPRTIEPRGALAEYERTAVDLFEDVSPAVVHITTPEVVYRNAWGWYEQVPGGTGTGFVWNENGYIVTNSHVVAGRKEVLVRFANQREHTAVVVGQREDLDIAVIKLHQLPPGLKPIPRIGTSADLKVGQAAFAIGNPFGYDQTLTTGIISALNRSIQTPNRAPINGCIQVDAAINPGNSGGPLLDSAGRLIGMNAAIFSPSGGSAGIGFAIPVDVINQIVPRLIEPGRGTLYLGVTTGVLRDEDGRPMVEIQEVSKGSGAEEAGLQGRTRRRLGDVIVAIDGTAVTAQADIAAVLREKKSGDTAKLTILRGLPYEAQRLDVDVPLR